MASYNKFEVFPENLASQVHDLFGAAGATNVVKVYLSNTSPSSAYTVKSQFSEIAAGNGYTAGGSTVTLVGTRSGFTLTGTGSKVVWTATGAVGGFRYVGLYDDTPSTPPDPLIAWWDHASVVTLANGDTFSVRFNSSDGTGNIFTIG